MIEKKIMQTATMRKLERQHEYQDRADIKTETKRELDKLAVIVGDFSTSLPIMDRQVGKISMRSHYKRTRPNIYLQNTPPNPHRICIPLNYMWEFLQDRMN